jgi:hypothetical protein
MVNTCEVIYQTIVDYRKCIDKWGQQYKIADLEKYLDKFNSESDINELKTILLVIKDWDIVKDQFNHLSAIYKQKYNKL